MNLGEKLYSILIEGGSWKTILNGLWVTVKISALALLLGTALGLVFGVFFHQFVVQTAETDATMFGRTVYAMSYVYAAGLSLAFTGLVSLALKGKLGQMDMVESLKAPE